MLSFKIKKAKAHISLHILCPCKYQNFNEPGRDSPFEFAAARARAAGPTALAFSTADFGGASPPALGFWFEVAIGLTESMILNICCFSSTDFLVAASLPHD